MLYALSHLLYTVGKEPYKDSGINWLYHLVKHASTCNGTLYNDTLFCMEEYIGDFYSRHRMEFRTNRVIAQKTQAVLEYMLNQGSQTAFFIREQI